MRQISMGITVCVLSAIVAICAAAEPVLLWDFAEDGEDMGWVPNAGLGEVEIQDGVVTGLVLSGDAFFLNRNVEAPTSPYQYVSLRIRSDRKGAGKFYWSQTLEGVHGGLSEAQSQGFDIEGTGAWETVVIFPFWHTVETIRQMRINLPHGARFALDRIEIRDWREEAGTGAGDQTAWDADAIADWWTAPNGRLLLTPMDGLAVEDLNWATLRIQSENEGLAALVWATAGQSSLHYSYFPIDAGDTTLSYNVEVVGLNAWESPIIALGVLLPERDTVTLESLALSDAPTGPAQLEVTYFALENYPNRIGIDAPLLLRIQNRGGQAGSLEDVALHTPEGLEIVAEPELDELDAIPHGQYRDLAWQVRASGDSAQDFEVTANFTGSDAPPAQSATLHFTPSLNLAPADYVPEPQPIETELDIAAYYFPGWDSTGKWRPIHTVSPIRKPTLGYYDESDPEVVDWQIKWAVENGISIFLVDWYWVDSARHLEHWFEAYREARYRDYLDVAIMWANHNPPGTHSHEDWIRVTEHWIEHYFSLDSYYHIEGKPAVFIWDPRGIRNDLGSSEAVRAAFDESQRLAREAGYEGIYYAALFGHESRDMVEMLIEEGYHGTTTYHEWGDVTGPQTVFRREDFEEVVRTVPDHWDEKRERSEPLDYFPVATTGWDSRPWHGDASLVIANRTPDRWERLLRLSREYVETHDPGLLVIGPMNEWGEGSYIEPATEYGFEMYEAIRTVFGVGDPADWPVNIAPVDVGLGPYDLAPMEPRTAWDFTDGRQGWVAMMGIGDLRHEDEALHFHSTTHDPAFTVDLAPFDAADYQAMELEMQLVGDDPGHGQIFWSTDGRAASESTSVRFDIEGDGVMRTYRIDLGEHPRWRSQITGLRVDPCSRRDIEVRINAFRLVPAED